MPFPKIPFTKDQWIQVVAIMVPASVATVAAVRKIIQWHQGRKSLTITITRVKPSPVYVHSIYVSKTAPGRVRSVAIWLQFRLYNFGKEPELITSIFTEESEGTTREMIALFDGATITLAAAAAKRPVTLPMTLGRKKGREFFGLVEVQIPPELGRVLYELYVPKVRAIQLWHF